MNSSPPQSPPTSRPKLPNPTRPRNRASRNNFRIFLTKPPRRRFKDEARFSRTGRNGTEMGKMRQNQHNIRKNRDKMQQNRDAMGQAASHPISWNKHSKECKPLLFPQFSSCLTSPIGFVTLTNSGYKWPKKQKNAALFRQNVRTIAISTLLGGLVVEFAEVGNGARQLFEVLFLHSKTPIRSLRSCFH